MTYITSITDEVHKVMSRFRNGHKAMKGLLLLIGAEH